MGNAINAALLEPTNVGLIPAIVAFNDLHIRDIEVYWRSFYEHAESFVLTRSQLREILSKAARLLDPHGSSKRAIQHADSVFDALSMRTGGAAVHAKTEDAVMDALEFFSAIAFISAEPIDDKIDLLFDSWDMSEDGALDLDELTISLKSTFLGLSKILTVPTDNKSATFLDDDEIEVLGERVFREIAKISSVTANLNQVTITCDQFRTYCTENKSARAMFDLFDRATTMAPGTSDGDTEDTASDDEHQVQEGSQIEVKDSSGSVSDVAVIDQGDEFLAVKPWKGAIVAPSKIPPLDAAAPVVSVALEWIFGYNAQESKNNVRFCTGTSNEIVYPAAAACVVLNLKTRTQRHYLAHVDDVLCLCVHPKLNLVASGEIGKKPQILVWSSKTMDTMCTLRGFHQRAVLQLAFCGESTLVSVGNDDDHSVAVYETKDGWNSAMLKEFSKGSKATPSHLTPSPTALEFVCCGDKHIDFWQFDGKALAHKKALLGSKGTSQLFHVAEYVNNGSAVVVGTNDGNLYVFTGRDLSSVVKTNAGAIHALGYMAGVLVVGTKGGQVSMWDEKLKLVNGPFNIKDVTCNTAASIVGVRSCALAPNKKTILVGTLASEVYELDAVTGKNVHTDALVTGHFLGETWGLDTHPSKPQCCTIGDDKTVRIWDLETKKELRAMSVDLPGRACAYSSDGKMIAVGLGADGGSSVAKTRGAKKPAGGFVVFTEQDLTKVKEPRYDAKKWVSDIKFSPDDRTLAVASHDTVVYFYDVLKGFSKKPEFKKHTSYITHIDFSSDGHHLQSTCGGYELLFNEAKTARHITNASSLRDERWHTMTSTLGWGVQGIWEECSDGTDVNSVDRSHDGKLLATGDDFGKVKLFRYPCAIEKASYVELRGHASHVTKVKWTAQDKWLLSTGGNDRCLFVWRNENASSSSRESSVTTKTSKRDIDSGALRGNNNPIDEFAEAEEDVGDEFMSVKPWLGAIVPPSDAKNIKISSIAPEARLDLERVHGYQAQNAANNARYDDQGKVVYHAAALGIVFDKATQRQSFFKHHDDDIVALCAHPNNSTFATAQMGKKPKIYTWNASSPGQSISCLEGFHQRVVTAICFSSDGKKLGSVGGDDDHSVAIYSWENGTLTASAKGERSNVLAICHHDGMWISCGGKHVRFWREQGKNLTSKKAIFGSAKHKADKMPGVFECVVSFGKWAVVGASNGDLYCFQGSNDLTRIVRAHAQSAQALYAVNGGADELVSGGKDGTIMVWDSSLQNTFKFDLKEIAASIDVLNASIRSVCPGGRGSRNFLIGTHGSDLIELDTSRPAASIVNSMTVITKGHSAMELWAIATHPSRKEYCTAGDDQLLRVWCLEKKTLLRQCKLDAMARACTIHSSGKTEVIAVGLGGRHASAAAKSGKQQNKTGTFVIVSYAELYKKLFEDKPTTQPISEIKFSPDGTILAIGSHDNRIYLYKIQDPKSFKKVVKVATFAKHQSYITHFDFSVDGRFLRSNCGAYELLFSDATTGKHITSASSVKDVKWQTWTCVLGWPVQGIWPPCSDGTDVNAVDRSSRGDLLVSSDDFGLVKLFRYPCVGKNASAIEHRGHSSHVTNVRWTAKDSHVVSVGGNDRCIMEWKLIRDSDDSEALEADIEENIQEEEDTEEEIDEDVEGDEFMAVKPWLGAIAAPTNAPTPNTREPDLRVQLDWVYGYHTELSKQNLVYNSHKEIVYHTAAVGVIYDGKHHIQKHHMCHNDDIMSFAITSKRDIVATGERGKKPVIRIWDAHSGELRCELKGFHSRGVVSLAFSPDGSKLLSVGDDDNHCVALWEDASQGCWTVAKLAANAKGDKGVNRFSCFGKDTFIAVTGGGKHVLFWRVEGKTLVNKKGKVGKKGTLQMFPCGAAFGTDIVTGTASGELYVWTGGDLSKVIKAHEGESTVVSVHEMPSTDRQSGTVSVLLSGGKDGKVMMWNSAFQILKTVDLAAMSVGCFNKAIASVFMSSDDQALLIGTCSSDIIEVGTANGTVLHGGSPLFSGHFKMELWGLAVHPSAHQFTTTGDDGTLRVWNMDTKRSVLVTKLSHKARACAYSPDASMLAIGFGGDNGVRRISKGKSAGASKEGAFAVLGALDGKVLFEDRPAKEWISDIKFSPCGSLLGVGSHDNAIHLYSASGGFKKRKPFAKHNSYITHFDFSKDSKYLQSNCGAYELLFCDTSTSDQVRSASSLKDVAWSTWTCTLGWPVQGIWPECADGTDINAVCASSSRSVLATGDDFGKVKFFRYPCTMKGARFINARGHSSHVTNVRFSFDDKFLISVGGNDRTIFQWKLS